MPELNLYLYPGRELKELLDKQLAEGKKYPLGESLTLEDNKDISCFTIKEDIIIKAGTKLHLNAWVTQTKKSQATQLKISCVPFEEGYEKAVSYKKPKENVVESSNDDEELPNF